MNFKEKVVLVTGSSSGIGAVIAQHFAKEGAQVVLVSRNVEKLEAVARQIVDEKNAKPYVVAADITKDEDARRMVENVIAKYGRIDVLINNAGIVRAALVASDNTMKVYDEVMNVNLRAVVNLTQLSYPHVAKVKGNIINISSTISFKDGATPDLVAYTVSKAALNSFTRCCAAEFASAGVRVNAICPGPVRTDIINGVLPNEMASSHDAFWLSIQKNTLLNRISGADEVADLALYLASDKARAITGSLMVIDNGWKF